MSFDDRSFQRRCVADVLGHLYSGVPGVLLVAATGAGKTHMCCQVAIDWLQSRDSDVWFTVHKHELLEQASKAFTKNGIDHGIIASGVEPTSKRVHIVMQPTAVRRGHSLDAAAARVGLTMPDEAHHTTSEGWEQFLARLRGQRCGATATPYRLDGSPLGKHFDVAVEAPPMAELADDGYLVQARTFAPPVPYDVYDTRKVRRQAGDLARNELATQANNTAFRQLALHYYERYLAGEPTIVSCVDVQHSLDMAKDFRRAGWRARAVYGDMDAVEGKGSRERAFDGLRDGSVQILTFCELISEGVDVPRCAGLIKLRETLSTSLEVQIAGRTLRPVYAPGFSRATREDRLAAIAASEKPVATVIDLVGNLKKHGMHDEKRPWSLQQGIKGMERVVRRTIRCRKCYLVETDTGQAACSLCGAWHPKTRVFFTEPPKSYAHLVVQGATAAQVAVMSMDAKRKLAKTEQDFINIGLICGYAPGWARMQWETRLQYQQKFTPRSSGSSRYSTRRWS